MSNTEKPVHICCFCGKDFTGWGNNPWPVCKTEGATCCDECNTNVVVPERLRSTGIARIANIYTNIKEEPYV